MYGKDVLCAKDMVDCINANSKVSVLLVVEENIQSIDALIPAKLEVVRGT